MPIIPSRMPLSGGVLCLDFTNTKNRNPAEGAFEFFVDYSRLLRWGLQLGLLSQSEAETLLELAGARQGEAQAALERTTRLREAIYTVFAAVEGSQTVPAEALALLNLAWTNAMNHLQVSLEGNKFGWKWVGMERALDGVLWPVVKSAAELLVSENLNRVKRCNGCNWLFLDTTRDARRRWCDMKLCGNRAKARRHYDRMHSPAGAPE